VNPQALVVVISGLSGAGRSTALTALEDLGFFCVDNLPAPVIEQTVASCLAGGVLRIGLGIDIRVRSFLAEAAQAIGHFAENGRVQVRVLFLDATDEVVLRRFSSTRRPHPLSTFARRRGEGAAAEAEPTTTTAVIDGLQEERRLLAPLRALATDAIDTSNLSVHELRRRIVDEFSDSGTRRLLVRLISFGFKYGPPSEADTLFDVRFIDNPFFKEELRPQTGLDEPVRRYVLDQEATGEFVRRVEDLLLYLLPRYAQEGKSYLTLGIGCTGGQHRSVAITEELAGRLRQNATEGPHTYGFEVRHRDIHRARVQPGEGPQRAEGRGVLEGRVAVEGRSVSDKTA
jgi:UPF0042 nucleotide-binding protein